ncbi:MAG: glycine--tRNA ligase subunit beta, partial [Actinomycetota bacterium]
MIVSVPREVKNNEYRVAITASGVHELVTHGHEVLVEAGAGIGSGIDDDAYTAAGAQILADADELWARADMVLKVKEPVASEYHRFREGLVLFTYLHLAAEPELTAALLKAGVTAIAYETVQTADRRLPLLAPMSEVAGRLAVQAGAAALTAPAGGKGVLLGGVPGVRPAKVTVLGAGVAGTNAAAMAVGLGAEVTVLDVNVDRLREHHVLVEIDARREAVRRQINALMREHGSHLQDEVLLEEVTNLVEWPYAVEGSFDEGFLDVPDPIVTAAMKGHQRYFPVRDADGRLLPRFVTVSNRTGEQS